MSRGGCSAPFGRRSPSARERPGQNPGVVDSGQLPILGACRPFPAFTRWGPLRCACCLVPLRSPHSRVDPARRRPRRRVRALRLRRDFHATTLEPKPQPRQTGCPWCRSPSAATPAPVRVGASAFISLQRGVHRAECTRFRMGLADIRLRSSASSLSRRSVVSSSTTIAWVSGPRRCTRCNRMRMRIQPASSK